MEQNFSQKNFQLPIMSTAPLLHRDNSPPVNVSSLPSIALASRYRVQLAGAIEVDGYRFITHTPRDQKSTDGKLNGQNEVVWRVLLPRSQYGQMVLQLRHDLRSNLFWFLLDGQRVFPESTQMNETLDGARFLFSVSSCWKFEVFIDRDVTSQVYYDYRLRINGRPLRLQYSD
jgi:hypothetical protein